MLEFDIALTISVALAAGLVSQTIAHHMRIPGIVLLLITGAILGPEMLHIVNPDVYKSSLHMLVGFAVAVILFEGGLNLDIKRLKRESIAIRQLVTVGALITVVGGMLIVHFVLGWDWQLSLLFGTLVSVTGPTVVTPLLRRIRLNKNLATVLEAEGVLIDPIGALIAIIALEYVIVHPTGSSFFVGFGSLMLRLGFGAVLGAAGGFVLALLLRPKKLIPENLQNILVLTFILVLYHVSNHFQGESGIGAVTVAGIVIGNFKTRTLTDLVEFKEQLTTMFIAMLFVLLAADVSFADIELLGVPGLIVVSLLMFLVRPINVFVSTIGTSLTLKEKIFMSWMAPRGIVAAAVASFFAVTLEQQGYEGGALLRALVFLVIAITVTAQGMSGGFVAKLLKVSRESNNGYTIVGANQVGIALAGALKRYNEEVQFIDTNTDMVRQSEEAGFKVIFGNALEETILLRASLDSRKGCIGLTSNEEVNLLFIQKAKEEYKVQNLFISLQAKIGDISEKMVEEIGGLVLFGVKRDVELWDVRIRRNRTTTESWACTFDETKLLVDSAKPDSVINNFILPLIRVRDGSAEPVTNNTKVRSGDEVTFVIYEEKRKEVTKWFGSEGWVFIPENNIVEDGEVLV